MYFLFLFVDSFNDVIQNPEKSQSNEVTHDFYPLESTDHESFENKLEQLKSPIFSIDKNFVPYNTKLNFQYTISETYSNTFKIVEQNNIKHVKLLKASNLTNCDSEIELVLGKYFLK